MIEQPYSIRADQNLPNHSLTAEGYGRFVQLASEGPLTLRTQEAVYKLCAKLILESEDWLPNPDALTLEDVIEEYKPDDGVMR